MEDCLFLGATIFFVTKDREAFKNGQKKQAEIIRLKYFLVLWLKEGWNINAVHTSF